MKFTDRSIRALKPRAERYEIWKHGEPGFGIRVAPSGRKTFVYLYRFDGRPRRMTLGVFRDGESVSGNQERITLAETNLRLARAKAKLEAGADPGTEKIARRQADQDALAIGDVIDELIADPDHQRKRSKDYIERILEAEIRPAWGQRKAKDIRRRDIILLRDKIKGRGSAVMANRVVRVVSQLFDFAIDKDILQATPYVKIKPATREIPRDRVLSEAEIESFWKGLDTAKMEPVVRDTLRLLLVTGQRRGEVAGARWAEIDLDSEKVWAIPGTRTKNGRTHVVPLSELAIKLLRDLKKRAGESEFVFPAPAKTGRKGEAITAHAATRAMRNNLALFEFACDERDPTPHDLRRTVATHMGRLGISQFIQAKVLNHTDRSVTGSVYNHHEYLAEKCAALARWANELHRIVHGKKREADVVRIA